MNYMGGIIIKSSYIFEIGLGLIVILVLIVPLASAALESVSSSNAQDYLTKDDPQIVAALKSNVVYVGESQQARMDGIIRYVDCISNGSAVEDLKWTKEDYLTAASTIPLMYTTDEINTGRKEMQDQSVLFSDISANQLTMFNGKVETMRVYINDSMQGFESTFNDPNRTPWLTTGRARLTVFTESANERNTTLALLSSRGVDISNAQRISDEINAEHEDLLNALSHKGNITITTVNSRIKMLNQDFRNTVRQYLVSLQIQAQTAAIMAMPD